MIKSINKWAFVATGIIFNISAAIITHYFIGINDQHLMQLDRKTAEYDTLIQSQWRIKTETDRKQEFLLLLLHQNSLHNEPKTISFIIQQLNQSLSLQQLGEQSIDADATIDYDTIIDTSERIRQQIISRINNTYLDRLVVEDSKVPLQERNSTLFSIAIFLQLTGLILVLAKDIGK